MATIPGSLGREAEIERLRLENEILKRRLGETS